MCNLDDSFQDLVLVGLVQFTVYCEPDRSVLMYEKKPVWVIWWALHSRKCTSCRRGGHSDTFMLAPLAQELSPHFICNNSIIVGIGRDKRLPVLSNSLLALYGGCGSNHIIDPGVRSMRTYSIMSRVTITANAMTSAQRIPGLAVEGVVS